MPQTHEVKLGKDDKVVIELPNGDKLEVEACAGTILFRTDKHFILQPVSDHQINVRTRWPGL